MTLGKFLLSLLIGKTRGGLESGREKKGLKEGRGGEGTGGRGGQRERGQQLRDPEDKGVSLRKQE